MLKRLEPQQWLLEWALPLWLADAFEIDREIGRLLALCNLLGLTHIRLQDDWADAEIGDGQRPVAAALSTLALQAALQRYVYFFPADSLFWPALNRHLRTWAQALQQTSLAARGPAILDESSASILAQRGAPLKIGATAACLLADRTAELIVLERSLTDILAAEVYLDHAHDWSQDLEAGRFNALVAYASEDEQTPALRAINHQRVLELFYVGDGAGAYFQAAARYAQHTAQSADQVGCPPLASYARWFATEALAYGQEVSAEAQRQVQSLATAVFSGGI